MKSGLAGGDWPERGQAPARFSFALQAIMGLVKAIPTLPALPFGTINAVVTLAAPVQGRYIESNQCSKQDDEFHHALLPAAIEDTQVAFLYRYLQSFYYNGNRQGGRLLQPKCSLNPEIDFHQMCQRI